MHAMQGLADRINELENLLYQTMEAQLAAERRCTRAHARTHTHTHTHTAAERRCTRAHARAHTHTHTHGRGAQVLGVGG